MEKSKMMRSRKNILNYITIVVIILFILYDIFSTIQGAKSNAECPNWYYKTKIYPKIFKAQLIKKNKKGGKGVLKPGLPSIDLDNQGEILHIGVNPNAFSNSLFNNRFWEYAEEGDSIIKPKNSYQLKVVRGGTVKIFELDCEAYKRELKGQKSEE